jgi:hypothetical protein
MRWAMVHGKAAAGRCSGVVGVVGVDVV